MDSRLKAEILLFHGKMGIMPMPTSPAPTADMKISEMGMERMTTKAVKNYSFRQQRTPATEYTGRRSKSQYGGYNYEQERKSF